MRVKDDFYEESRMSFPYDIVFDDLGRHATHQRIFGNVGGDDRTGGDDRAAANTYAFENGGVQADPYMIFDHDRRRNHGVAIDRVIIAIADGDPAGDGDAMPDSDGGKAIDGGIVVDVAAAQGERCTFINCQMAARHQVKMTFHRNFRILGQLEL